MKAKQLLLASSISGILAMAPMALAVGLSPDLNTPTPASEMSAPSSDLTFTPSYKTPSAAQAADKDKTDQKDQKDGSDVNYLDAAPAETPNIHGFANLSVLTHYATPRGLVVADKDSVLQPIVGLVFPLGDVGPMKNLTFVGGIWNCITFVQHDPKVGPWNELDDFFSLSFDVLPNLNAQFTYVAFNSPNGVFTTENNTDLLLAYNDSSIWGGNFGLHPYVDLWWAINGDSTVVLGKTGHTGYVQVGIVPTYTIKAIPSYPITMKLPSYVSVGPKDYWSASDSLDFAHSPTGTPPPTGGSWGDGNVGVVNIGYDVGIPLSFIPTKYGYWHADASVTYFDLVNSALVDAGTEASGNTKRDVIVGEFTVGVSF